MDSSSSSSADFPAEILNKLQSFHQALEKAESILHPLLHMRVNSTDVLLSPLDKARLNLTCGYALNSLFWMYLNTLGIDPKQHAVKQELDRYKDYMVRAKEVSDKGKAPRLNKVAAQRFMRNALWQKKDDNTESESDEEHNEGTCSRKERKISKRKL